MAWREVVLDHDGKVALSKIVTLFVVLVITAVVVWLAYLLRNAEGVLATEVLSAIVQLIGILSTLAGSNYAFTRATDMPVIRDREKRIAGGDDVARE